MIGASPLPGGGMSWSAAQVVNPDATFSAGAPFNGFLLTPLDAEGDTVDIDSGLIFGATFASSGTFDAQLTAAGASSGAAGSASVTRLCHHRTTASASDAAAPPGE